MDQNIFTEDMFNDINVEDYIDMSYLADDINLKFKPLHISTSTLTVYDLENLNISDGDLFDIMMLNKDHVPEQIKVIINEYGKWVRPNYDGYIEEELNKKQKEKIKEKETKQLIRKTKAVTTPYDPNKRRGPGRPPNNPNKPKPILEPKREVVIHNQLKSCISFYIELNGNIYKPQLFPSMKKEGSKTSIQVPKYDTKEIFIELCNIIISFLNILGLDSGKVSYNKDSIDEEIICNISTGMVFDYKNKYCLYLKGFEIFNNYKNMDSRVKVDKVDFALNNSVVAITFSIDGISSFFKIHNNSNDNSEKGKIYILGKSKKIHYEAFDYFEKIVIENKHLFFRKKPLKDVTIV